MKYGAMGIVEDGPLKGRKFLIPSEVMVEKGKFVGGGDQFSKACVIHGEFIPDQGCPKCSAEATENE